MTNEMVSVDKLNSRAMHRVESTFFYFELCFFWRNRCFGNGTCVRYFPFIEKQIQSNGNVLLEALHLFRVLCLLLLFVELLCCF